MISYRGIGINSNLSKHAFECVLNDCISTITNRHFKNLILVYGLTKSNAGEQNGIDRTPSIIRTFMKFAHKIAQAGTYKKTESVIHSRYQSFMPTFDLQDSECKPLDDSHSIAGYGNVLIFPLIKK